MSAEATKPPEATPPAEPTPPPKPESMSKESAFFKRFTGEQTLDEPINKPTPPPAEKKEEPKPPVEAKPDDKKPAETPPASPPAEKPEEAKPAPPKIKRAKGYEAPVVDQEKLVATAATAATKAALEQVQSKPEPKREVQLTAEEQRDIAVLKVMEEANPDKYKGITERTMAFLRDLSDSTDDFRRRWEQSHPSTEFEGSEERDRAYQAAYADEVSAKKSEHNVEWEEPDFEEAKILKVVGPVMKERGELKNKIKELEDKTRQQEIAPAIERTIHAAARDITKQLIGDHADKIITASGLDAKALEELDPLAAPVYHQAITISAQFAAACKGAFEGVADQTTQNQIFEVCQKFEEDMGALGDDAVSKDGKPFMPRANWLRLPADQRKQFWTTSPDMVITWFNDRQAKNAKAYIQDMEQRVERRSARKATTTPPPQPTLEEAKPAPFVSSKPVSPAGVSPSAAPSREKPQEQQSDFIRRFVSGTTMIQ